jgi:hypothetical protein
MSPSNGRILRPAPGREEQTVTFPSPHPRGRVSPCDSDRVDTCGDVDKMWRDAKGHRR